MKKSMSIKKKVAKHLREDIKGYKHEIAEDKDLIKDIKEYKMAKNGCKKCDKKHEAKESKAEELKERMAGKKGDAKLKKEVNAGKKELKVKKVLREFKNKSLHSSSKSGPLVTKRSQALAIALNEGRKAAKSKKKTKKNK